MSDHMELDSIEHGVITDRSRMSRAFAERLPVTLARSTHVWVADGVERDRIDRIHLNVDVANGIDAPDSHLWPLPQAKGHGEAAGTDLIAKLSTELHRTGYRGLQADDLGKGLRGNAGAGVDA